MNPMAPMFDDPPIRLIRAANPSPLTGTGTNTWVLGGSDLAVIDPGPDLPSHFDNILSAIGPGQRISHIVVTHAHLDHSALAPRLSAATGAPVFAYGGAHSGRSEVMTRLAPLLPDHGEGLDRTFAPDFRLSDGMVLDGPDWSLAALHTPGHLGGHLCLALGETLVSGDHVMGWSTSIVAPPDGDMGDYMASLDRLRARRWRRMLPGHGDVIADPDERLAALVAHRRQREHQILDALADGPTGIAELTARIYTDLPPHLRAAASYNVFAHLIDLASRNLVSATPDLHPLARYIRL
jgi:glyoxylase-like metal-dependent hydrolase (beta-lactamase superfamily II)